MVTTSVQPLASFETDPVPCTGERFEVFDKGGLGSIRKYVTFCHHRQVRTMLIEIDIVYSG